MEYEVTAKTTSADDALSTIAMLPQPVYIAIIKGGYDIIKEHAYREIINKIRKIIPAKIENPAYWTIENMLADKKNAIFTIVDNVPGNLHDTLHALHRAVRENGQQGSIVGIRVKSSLRFANPPDGYSVELHSPISDYLDCLIVAYCS